MPFQLAISSEKLAIEENPYTVIARSISDEAIFCATAMTHKNEKH